MSGFGKKRKRDNKGFTERVLEYPKRIKGVVLMIVNFTGELTGYKKDKQDLREFFESIGYEVNEYKNCNKVKIFVAIDDVKRKLKESAGQINRVIVVLLSHGDVNGIRSCADEEGILTEMNGDKEVTTTTVEEITAEFKHDKDDMSILKGVPRMFIVQACHGQETTKAAGNSCGRRKGSDNEDKDIYKRTVPVDSDMLILSASTTNNKSYVCERNGSWLIQDTLAVFRRMHKKEEVERMLKAVIMSVSEKRSRVRNEDGSEESAIQLPIKQSTLRKDLFL